MKLVAIFALVSCLLETRAAQAESWCAEPLIVHEWGVQVFSGAGAGRRTGVPLPRYFHDRAGAPQAPRPPVRTMPADSGDRDLPVLHFYSGGGASKIPVAVEVGFAQGSASAWYPQVDSRREASEANGAVAAAARRRLLELRSARARTGSASSAALLPADPTRQLAWEGLSLERAPAHTPEKSPAQSPTQSGVSWVDRLRGFPDALWVNAATESERFVFYEARTSESPALHLERGPTYASGRRHYVIRNVSAHPVFDVFLAHREGKDTFLFYAPSVPAHATAGFLLEAHRVAAGAFSAASRDRLRAQLLDPNGVRASSMAPAQGQPCVMMRDPAVPVEAADGYRLYANEVDALLEIWGARFFSAPGTTLVYREDPRAVDAAMPLSIYTDMMHFVRLNRASFALMDDLVLP